VEEEPNDMYGKLMSLPDELILPYFEYLTDTPDAEIDDMSRSLASVTAFNPMDLKKRLAREITAAFHDQPAAASAQENFERVVQRRDLPRDIPEFQLGPSGGSEDRSLSQLLVAAGLASSNGEAKRLIHQRAVQLIRTPDRTETLETDAAGPGLQSGDVIKVGRRRFVRLTE
jgi:tyrosyl-tRNA synthetase